MNVSDEAMRRDVMDNWEAGAEQAIRKDWEADVIASHACADADEESEFHYSKLGKLSPREAVVLIKSISVEGGRFSDDYYAHYLVQVREIIRRLDM
jgi:hypothetical protein